MALWDNTGEASDLVNLYADIFGDGVVMDAYRARMAIEQPLQKQRDEKELQAICQRVKTTKERKVESSTGLAALASIPCRLYHDMASVFRMKAEDAGVKLDGNGYECWQDEDFLNYLRKHPKYQFLFYKEAPRNARIVVNDTPRPLIAGGSIIAAA